MSGNVAEPGPEPGPEPDTLENDGESSAQLTGFIVFVPLCVTCVWACVIPVAA